MPLPHPPGYTPRRQCRVDRRRIVFSAGLAAVTATVLLVLFLWISIFENWRSRIMEMRQGM